MGAPQRRKRSADRGSSNERLQKLTTAPPEASPCCLAKNNATSSVPSQATGRSNYGDRKGFIVGLANQHRGTELANGFGVLPQPTRLRPDPKDGKSGVVVDHARAEPPFTREAAGCNPLLGG